jgi:hypothetical protein
MVPTQSLADKGVRVLSHRCERREIARRRLRQAGAPLSWTSERADTHFVCEASEEGSGEQAPDSASGASNPKRRERRRSSLFDCSLPLAADRARGAAYFVVAPDEEHVGSLLRSTAARDPVRATTKARGSEATSSPSGELCDEVGGFSMFAPPISQQIARAQRAPAPAASCVQEEMAEQRFSVPSAPTKTAATQRTSPRAERAIKQSAIARAAKKRGR